MGSPAYGYCGPAPDPGSVWGRWNLDPVLVGALAVVTVLGIALLRRHHPAGRLPFSVGLVLFTILFVSPLCALGVALASARIGHHLLLTGLVAPLLVLAIPPRLIAFTGPLLVPALILHTVIFWIWHHPIAYDEALVSSSVYWFMQLTLLASAMLFWSAALAARLPAALGGLAAATMQMGLLGALFVFAETPFYAGHLTSALDFGFTPEQDQQLGGLLMWVPAAVPYLGVALWRLTVTLLPTRGEAHP